MTTIIALIGLLAAIGSIILLAIHKFTEKQLRILAILGWLCTASLWTGFLLR